MPLLDWFTRRFRKVREAEREVERRELRTKRVMNKAHEAVNRADRLAREMQQMGKVL